MPLDTSAVPTPQTLLLNGLSFGPWQVIGMAGRMSNHNWSWSVRCTACGHMNRRLGTHLVNGRRLKCPACGHMLALSFRQQRALERARVAHRRRLRRELEKAGRLRRSLSKAGRGVQRLSEEDRKRVARIDVQLLELAEERAQILGRAVKRL